MNEDDTFKTLLRDDFFDVLDRTSVPGRMRLLAIHDIVVGHYEDLYKIWDNIHGNWEWLDFKNECIRRFYEFNE